MRQVRTFLRFRSLQSASPARLDLNPRLSIDQRARLAKACEALPKLAGNPIRICVQPELTAHRGKLLSRSLGRGTPVYAGSFIRERQIVLESELLSNPEALSFIAIHEIFHFVWARLGNPKRDGYAALLRREWEERARGELGESSGLRKDALRDSAVTPPSRLWREYVCESFCDTAAWFYTGFQQSGASGLARRWSERRKLWFSSGFTNSCRC